MTKYKIYDGNLYDYTAGVYCGVLIKESVMKKLAKLQAKHLQEVKRILLDGADNEEVFPSGWTLHYPEGEQTDVRYIDTDESVSRRIKTALITHKPEYRPLVFIAKSMQEAKEMADEKYNDELAD